MQCWSGIYSEDLLLQQRTSTTWLAAIQRSNTLQERLFFKATATNEERWPNAFPQWNPLLSKISTHTGFIHHRGYPAICEIVFKAEALFELDRPEASWRRMSISNAIISYGHIRVSSGQTVDICIKKPENLKMDRLANMLWNALSMPAALEDPVITIMIIWA